LLNQDRSAPAIRREKRHENKPAEESCNRLSARKHCVCSVYFALQRAAGQLAQSHNFQRSSKNTQHLPRFEPLLSQLTSLVSCERARQSVGPRRPIANPILHRVCFQSTRSQTCVSTLNEMVARNWKIFCHRGRVDQGQRLNICERGQSWLFKLEMRSPISDIAAKYNACRGPGGKTRRQNQAVNRTSPVIKRHIHYSEPANSDSAR